MDTGLFMMVGGIAILSLLINYLIIREAVSDSKLSKQNQSQIKLLALIAKKSGSSDEEIKNCL